MGTSVNPYDELPYRCFPIEWTAPERLAVASVLHGGPRPPLDRYRVLELGCGTGGNVLPLAYYRRGAAFVGVDGAASQVDDAKSRAAALGLRNVEFHHADFLETDRRLAGTFDYVIAHGVFSWVAGPVRDALLRIFERRLKPGGLLYLNYNTRPGWNVRGLVRDFLLAQTDVAAGRRARAEAAKEACARAAAALEGVEHPYSRLLANEFRFVAGGDVTWVSHEFLADDNHPYWRSDFLALVRGHGLEYVADADFNYASGRVPPDLAPKLDVAELTGRCLEDTVDLLCYRQLHSPILTRSPLERRPVSAEEFGRLYVASPLGPAGRDDAGNALFKHPNGFEVEARQEPMRAALSRLHPIWPRGVCVAEAFADPAAAREDLELLQRNGLVELRCIEPGDFGVDPAPLNALEHEWGGYFTTAYHQTGRG
jgi:SAM-dependent methyltransferase